MIIIGVHPIYSYLCDIKKPNYLVYMKKIVLFLTMLVGVLAAQAEEYTYLTFEMTNGAKVSVSVEGLTLTISGDLLTPSECRLDLIPAGQTVSIADINIEPDIDKLRGITESTETKFTLSIQAGGEEVYNHTYPIHLMAFDQWPGSDVMP